MTVDHERLAAISELLDSTTPGLEIQFGFLKQRGVHQVVADGATVADYAFIANSRVNMRWLLDLVDELVEDLAHYESNAQGRPLRAHPLKAQPQRAINQMKESP